MCFSAHNVLLTDTHCSIHTCPFSDICWLMHTPCFMQTVCSLLALFNAHLTTDRHTLLNANSSIIDNPCSLLCALSGSIHSRPSIDTHCLTHTCPLIDTRCFMHTRLLMCIHCSVHTRPLMGTCCLMHSCCLLHTCSFRHTHLPLYTGHSSDCPTTLAHSFHSSHSCLGSQLT